MKLSAIEVAPLARKSPVTPRQTIPVRSAAAAPGPQRQFLPKPRQAPKQPWRAMSTIA